MFDILNEWDDTNSRLSMVIAMLDDFLSFHYELNPSNQGGDALTGILSFLHIIYEDSCRHFNTAFEMSKPK